MHTIDAVDHVYAKSLFDLSHASGRESLDEVFDELEQVLDLVRADRRFAEFLRSPIIDRERREGAMRTIFSGQVSDLVLRFLLVLNRKGRLGKLEGIVNAFHSIYYDAFGTVELDVWTAEALGDDQATALHDRLKQTLGREIVLHRYVDPGMIGGIRVRQGDHLFDASVSSQLRRLRQAIDTAGMTAVRERNDELLERDD